MYKPEKHVCVECGNICPSLAALDVHYGWHDRNGSDSREYDVGNKEYNEELEFLKACETMSEREASRWVRGNRVC